MAQLGAQAVTVLGGSLALVKSYILHGKFKLLLRAGVGMRDRARPGAVQPVKDPRLFVGMRGSGRARRSGHREGRRDR